MAPTFPLSNRYRFLKTNLENAQSLVQTVLPKAKVTLDANQRALLIVGTLREHQVLEQLVQRLESATGDDQPPLVLKSYKLKSTPSSTLLSFLQRFAPSALITPDGKKLMVVATEAEHATIGDTISKIDLDPDRLEKPKLVRYPVTDAQRKRFDVILTSLQSDFPSVRVITDAQPGELAIWAKSFEHKTIAAILDELKQETPEEQRQRLAVFTIHSSDPNTVTTLLQSMHPGARLMLDTPTGRLLAWGQSETLAQVEASLKALVPSGDAGNAPRFEVYATEGVDSSQLLATLQPLFPTARLNVDLTTGHLIAWATPQEHERLVSAVEKLTGDDNPTRVRTVEVYHLRRLDVSTAQTALGGAVPKAVITPDAPREPHDRFSNPP